MHRTVVVAAGLALVATALVTAPPAAVGGTQVRVTRDVVYRSVDGEPVLLDAFVPTARTTKRPAILLVHGGAWRAGDKSDFTADAISLAILGYVAFSLNYRLTPLHPYPAAVDDVEAAVRWLRAPAQVKAYALDPKRIGAIGSSAGGHLVGMLATLGSGPLTSGARIRAAVSWSGPMNFSLWPVDVLADSQIGNAVLSFLGCTADSEPCTNATPASPISHVDATDAPMLLANSEHELVKLSQATTMHAALQSAGVVDQLVVLPGVRHAQAFGADVWKQTVSFLARYVGRPPAPKS